MNAKNLQQSSEEFEKVSLIAMAAVREACSRRSANKAERNKRTIAIVAHRGAQGCTGVHRGAQGC